MNANAVSKSHIDEGCGLVDVATAPADEPDREPAHGGLVGLPVLDALQASRDAVGPELAVAGDEEVGDAGSLEVGRQDAEGLPHPGLRRSRPARWCVVHPPSEPARGGRSAAGGESVDGRTIHNAVEHPVP